MKSTDCNADMVWPQVGLPKHRRSARRAKMRPNLSSFLPVADIDFGWPFDANMLLLEKGNNAEHRAGSPLTLATMADAYNIRIGGYLDTQGTATAMRGSRHGTPSLSGAARLQEGGCQSDRLLSIVLLAANYLSGRLRGASRRADVALLNKAPILFRERLEIYLDEDLDGLVAVDLDEPARRQKSTS
jgi:hypothetical protein